MTSTKIFRWFALDMAIWACVPTLFLFAYVHYQDAPPDAVLPHYRLVLLSFLCLAVLRITLSQLILNRFVTQLAAASVTVLLLIILILYYSLVLVGLGSWGQVISYDLIASYATQIPDLADTLGISIFLAVCAILFGYALLLVAASVYIRRFDWTPHLARYLGGWRAIGIAAFGAAICDGNSEFYGRSRDQQR